MPRCPPARPSSPAPPGGYSGAAGRNNLSSMSCVCPVISLQSDMCKALLTNDVHRGLWLTHKFNNRTPSGCRLARPFIPITPIQPLLSMWALRFLSRTMGNRCEAFQEGRALSWCSVRMPKQQSELVPLLKITSLSSHWGNLEWKSIEIQAINMPILLTTSGPENLNSSPKRLIPKTTMWVEVTFNVMLDLTHKFRLVLHQINVIPHS